MLYRLTARLSHAFIARMDESAAMRVPIVVVSADATPTGGPGLDDIKRRVQEVEDRANISLAGHLIAAFGAGGSLGGVVLNAVDFIAPAPGGPLTGAGPVSAIEKALGNIKFGAKFIIGPGAAVLVAISGKESVRGFKKELDALQKERDDFDRTHPRGGGQGTGTGTGTQGGQTGTIGDASSSGTPSRGDMPQPEKPDASEPPDQQAQDPEEEGTVVDLDVDIEVDAEGNWVDHRTGESGGPDDTLDAPDSESAAASPGATRQRLAKWYEKAQRDPFWIEEARRLPDGDLVGDPAYLREWMRRELMAAKAVALVEEAKVENDVQIGEALRRKIAEWSDNGGYIGNSDDVSIVWSDNLLWLIKGVPRARWARADN